MQKDECVCKEKLQKVFEDFWRNVNLSVFKNFGRVRVAVWNALQCEIVDILKHHDHDIQKTR